MNRTSALSMFVATLVASLIATAYGAAPLARTQLGFYRMMLGDFEITALNDGVVEYQMERVLPTAAPQQIASALFNAGLTEPVGMSYNAFLIKPGSKLVLIDTGTGGKLDDQPEFHGAPRSGSHWGTDCRWASCFS